ncbi:unnamed protein product, partial [Ectocarpus fasciculatus]
GEVTFRKGQLRFGKGGRNGLRHASAVHVSLSPSLSTMQCSALFIIPHAKPLPESIRRSPTGCVRIICVEHVSLNDALNGAGAATNRFALYPSLNPAGISAFLRLTPHDGAS